MFICNQKPDGPTTSESSVGACKTKLQYLHITTNRTTISTYEYNQFSGLEYSTSVTTRRDKAHENTTQTCIPRIIPRA
jgi:hypothetical protein